MSSGSSGLGALLGAFCKVSVQGWVYSRRDFLPAAGSWLWDEAEQELCVPVPNHIWWGRGPAFSRVKDRSQS